MTKERPILFSDRMVCAILEGRKTQTRRVAKHPVVERSSRAEHLPDGWFRVFASPDEKSDHCDIRCPYGTVGDYLWVREAWAPKGATGKIYYRADGELGSINVDRWKPSIHMPRKLSRITLEITGVRVERLQEISEADAIAEGCPAVSLFDLDCESTPPSHHFRNLWDSINAERAPWASNPWIWIIVFRKV